MKLTHCLQKFSTARLDQILFYCFISLFPTLVFADEMDPMSKAGQKFYYILFGSLGTAVCAIGLGATFILAYIGKMTWDRFLYVGFCMAGFIGTPSIIGILKSTVG